MPFQIRPEQSGDHNQITHIHRQAFGRDNEGRLVHRLRRESALQLSLVTVQDDLAIAHIAFSGVTLSGAKKGKRAASLGLALGPVGVLPNHQGEGLGLELIKAALNDMVVKSSPFQVLVGEPELYGRFGFVAAESFGLSCEIPVPKKYFLLRVSPEQPVADFEDGDVLHYHNAFHSV
ncbi:GNAT family N-acetyltransferase [Echinimonas agarilytica]|uniref:N-acetyltransferase n=1 Tax=Echinimonas agarilytica TaxID=1215918 RepID=A0AA42B7F4_9GAMM|nr:N-acetyltransferase [Echinimonas agarilytica]MCM2679900.1 N-acetyltransferase [Echinimonas agarilytica]